MEPTFSQDMIVVYSFRTPAVLLKATVTISDTVSYMKTDVMQQQENVIVEQPSSELKPFFIKKLNTNKIYVYTSNIFTGKNDFIEDSLHTMKWTITKESKEILGMKCKSAITTFRGRTYKAFYTTKIPVSNGPWKFGGLPGLILEVNSTDGEYSWVITELSKKKHDKDFEDIDITKYKFMTWTEYSNFFKKLADKKIEWIKSETASDPNSGGGSFKIHRPEIIYPLIQVGNGFEYK